MASEKVVDMAGRRLALVVSCGAFQDEGLARLPATGTDAAALAEVLGRPDIGDYAVQVLRDPDVQTARVTIDEFFSDTRRDDLLVLYYAGHGVKDASGRLHLAANDTVVSRLSSTAIPADFVNQIMNDSWARQVAVILDCCYSGAFPRGMTARAAGTTSLLDEFSGRGRVVLTSSNSIEFAFEGGEGPIGTGDGPHGSVFTDVMVRGLATGAADLNEDGLVDTDELFAYLRDEVRKTTANQTPQMIAFHDGPFVFARVPGRTTQEAGNTSAVDVLVEDSVTAGAIAGVTATETVSTGDTPETAVDWAADAPARVDLLNRASLADVLASRLREVRRTDPSTSFLLHVDGAWGTGKSSLLNFLDERLAAEFTIVRFDAWRQSRLSPPWWALLSATRRGVAEGRRTLARGWLRMRETAARAKRSGAPYLLAAILLVVVLGALLWLAPLKGVATTVTAAAAAFGTLWAGLLVASRFLLWDSARGARLFEQSTANPMDDVAAHFGWLLDRSAKPVLFFIDDLDRCPAPYVIDLLDAIQTLVRDAPGGSSAYFVVAADGAWLRTSYEQAYQPFEGCVASPGYPLGYLFLDKLFQLTVPVPVPTPRARSTYLERLLHVTDPHRDERTRQEVESAQEQIARDVGDESRILRTVREASPAARELLAADAARALAEPSTRASTEHALRKFLPLLHANPRNIKKFLNTYSVLRSVRVLENNTVSSDVLALWTILRVRWPAMADHLERDPESVRGVVEPLWAEECFPAALRPLAADPDLRAVVTCRSGGPLTATMIRQCSGTVD